MKIKLHLQSEKSFFYAFVDKFICYIEPEVDGSVIRYRWMVEEQVNSEPVTRAQGRAYAADDAERAIVEWLNAALLPHA